MFSSPHSSLRGCRARFCVLTPVLNVGSAALYELLIEWGCKLGERELGDVRMGHRVVAGNSGHPP